MQWCHFIVRCSEYLLQSFGMTKRNELSLGQKIKVMESLQTRNQIQVASEFGISHSAVSWMNSRELTFRDGKKCRTKNGTVDRVS